MGSRNGISEKPKLFFRSKKKHLEKYFSKENKQKSTKKTTMDPGHLMLNRSIFSLYPSLAAQLAASPPLLQNWGVGRPLTQFQPQPDIKIERDSCGGSSASNASDTNGSGDEIDVDTIDNSSTSTRISANSLKFSIGNLLKEEAPKIAKPTSFWSPVQQILP